MDTSHLSFNTKYSKVHKLIKQYNLFFDIINHLNYNFELANIKINKITISMTNSCNMSCSYCNHKLRTLDSDDYNDNFDIKRVKEIIKKLIFEKKISDNCLFSFYGGEPLLKFSFIQQIINFIDSISPNNSFNYKIVTNGTLLSKQIAKFISKKNIYLQISLDGPKKIHDRNRCYKKGLPTYDRIMKNLQNLNNEDRNRISFNATLQSFKDAFIAERYFNKVTHNRTKGTYFINFDYNKNFNFTENTSNTYKELLYNVKIGNLKQLVMSDIFYNNYLSKINKIHKILRGKLIFSPYLGFCIDTIFKIFISQKGNITFCEQIFSSDQSYRINNGINLDMEKINFYKKTIYSFVKRNCLYCYANPWCNICFAHIASNGKFNQENILKYCNSSRNQFQEYLELYLKILQINKNFISELSNVIEDKKGGK